MRYVNGHEPIPRRPLRNHIPGLPLRRAMFRTKLKNETSPEPGINTAVFFSFPDLLVAHYGSQFLICPIPDRGSGFGRVDLPSDAPLLLDPTPCAMVTSLN